MKKVLKVSVVKLTEDFSWQRVTVRCLVGISYVSNRSYSQQNLKIKECCRCFQLCTVQKFLSWAPRRKYPQNRLKLVIRLLPCVRSPRLSNQMTEKGDLPVSTLLFYCWIIFLFLFADFQHIRAVNQLLTQAWQLVSITSQSSTNITQVPSAIQRYGRNATACARCGMELNCVSSGFKR